MYYNLLIFISTITWVCCFDDNDSIEAIDLTNPVIWKVMNDYHTALERNWKFCINCGLSGMGTAMHLENEVNLSSMHPAFIPPEYLVTKLAVVDVSSLVVLNPELILSLELALQWPALKHNPQEPTLLLFKFGWKEEPHTRQICLCKIPGISYELGKYIVANLTHVVGVATDTPTLETNETRHITTSISYLLGKNGIYMIENVNMKKRVPERGCMAIAMPMKMRNFNYAPTRLTAFCPMTRHKYVGLAIKGSGDRTVLQPMKTKSDVNLDDIMS